jgi:anti-sigma regulatory factor (Ser/Thr protein kinase)
MNLSSQLLIEDPSQVGEARRIVTSVGEDAGLGETERGKLALIITEAGNNLLKHAKRGKIVYRVLKSEVGAGIELLILDQGPGISDIGKSLQDGYSTAGTPGTGLGAIQRLSDYFEIYSQAGSGTVVLSQVFSKSYQESSRLKNRPLTPFAIGAISIPIKNETKCGDSWSWISSSDRTLLMVADGLGHGPKAAEASQEAERIFEQNIHHSPVQILEAAHRALYATRGAAMAVCEIIPEKRLIRYSGIGNITGLILPSSLHEESHHFVSLGGIVGQQTRRLQEFEYQWIPGSLLIMYSDGLLNRWKFDAYPGIKARHPSIIAGVLFRDFNRGNDDITVIVAKEI